MEKKMNTPTVKSLSYGGPKYASIQAFVLGHCRRSIIRMKDRG